MLNIGVECAYTIFSADVRCEKGYTMKAKADAKIRMTLTGAEVNVLEHILQNQKVVDRDAYLVVKLLGKLSIKQLKNPSKHQ